MTQARHPPGFVVGPARCDDARPLRRRGAAAEVVVVVDRQRARRARGRVDAHPGQVVGDIVLVGHIGVVGPGQAGPAAGGVVLAGHRAGGLALGQHPAQRIVGEGQDRVRLAGARRPTQVVIGIGDISVRARGVTGHQPVQIVVRIAVAGWLARSPAQHIAVVVVGIPNVVRRIADPRRGRIGIAHPAQTVETVVEQGGHETPAIGDRRDWSIRPVGQALGNRVNAQAGGDAGNTFQHVIAVLDDTVGAGGTR